MYFKIILIALAAYVLILIAYPETRLWLKELINKHPFLSGSLICLILVIIAFLYFPPFFKYVALDFWKIPLTIYSDGTVEVVELADLGSIGDIFGSLNSFISSIALCAVAFSTWLQVTSLKETRDANEQQMKLAKDAHDAQIMESKYSIFSNMFYALLNHKHSRYLSLQTRKKDSHYTAQDIFSHLNVRLVTHLMDNWAEMSTISRDDVKKDYFATMNEISNSINHSELFSYFKIVVDLYELINRSELDDEEKAFFKRVLSNSITAGENAALFWLGAFRDDLIELFENECVFNLGYDDCIMPFAVKFYRKECFIRPDIHKNWTQFQVDETPA